MATKREKELLTLCKATYEHFTSDALQLAKRIVAMEKEIEESEATSTGPATKPILEVSTPVADRPVTPLDEMVPDPEIIGRSTIASPPSRPIPPRPASALNISRDDLPF